MTSPGDIVIEALTAPPDRAKMDALLRIYYTGLMDSLRPLGGPDIAPDGPIADFWDHVHEFLPPDGSLYIARRGADWLGTGALRRLPDQRGELKRLFVHPDGRGLGLGRRLVEARIATARDMGLKTLYADTLTITREMQSLYQSLGFRQVDPYPESATWIALPELRPHMLFYRKDLT